MVSNLSLAGMIFTLLVSFLIPIVLIIYTKKRYSAYFSTIAVGALIFFVFVMVLEQLIHFYVLKLNETTKSLMGNTWIYAIYGGIAAGIFEETGRLTAFKFFLKKRWQWKDGLAYGIGHGGIEAMLVAGLTAINNLIYSLTINKGNFGALIGSKLPAATAEQVKNALINTDWYLFFVSGLERCFAISIQIGLSILVLYAVKNRKYIYYIIAILLHALVDFPAVLAQRGILSIWVVEGVAFTACIIGIYWAIKSKKVFNTDNISISVQS
ncbi:YhfC family intramembrane metalloprotease [Candidatus Clostridium radicumherbarum]|uniref:YhfC family intramembrane metalloprotease n=1 Tax=Candidatus Clostridium radicumherbarum TaxID=3381662 RepID=A0ABW8TX83_9CLOT